MGVKPLPVCPICDSTEYVLRQGEYFCRMCNTQSQELGLETVMDDDTIPGGLHMCDSISVGSKGSRKKDKSAENRRKLVEAEVWSTAEGFSYVLRGWVLQLKKMNIDIEIAVTQLWTLHLRELKMAFERTGEEGCVDPANLRFHDKLSLIGAAPGFAPRRFATRKKDKGSSSSEDENEDQEYSLRKARRLKKKRRNYFQRMSDVESVPDNASNANVSQTEASSPGTSGFPTSSSGSEFSEDGYITDASTASILYKRLNEGLQNEKERRTDGEDQKLKRKKKLCMLDIGSLIALALISKPGSTIMVEDVVRWFMYEELTWKNARTFLPSNLKNVRASMFRGDKELTTYKLGRRVHLIATQLPRIQNPSKIILVSQRITKSYKTTKYESDTFQVILERVLDDLCLPSFLIEDIISTFNPLGLLNMSVDIDNSGSETGSPTDLKNFQRIPSVMARVFGLILVALKYHFSLDDQYEIYHSHNVMMLRKWGQEKEPQFDIMEWIKASKLRLDYLMANDYRVKNQFAVMDHIGVPNLTPHQIVHQLKHNYPDRPGQEKMKKFEEMLEMLKSMKVNNDDPQPHTSTDDPFHPLLDKTKVLMENKKLSSRIKEVLTKLLEMPKFSLSLAYMDHNQRRKLFKYKRGYKFCLKRNYKVFNSYKRGMNINMMDNRSEYFKMLFTSKSPRSTRASVTVKPRVNGGVARKDFYVNVSKKYWFSGPAVRKCKISQNAGLSTNYSNQAYMRKILETLPDNFAWILDYFSCYSYVSTVELLQEVYDIENLILLLDEDYFGFFKAVKIWKKNKKEKKNQQSEKI